MTGRNSPRPEAPEAYLSGAIEHAADFGKGWRARMREFVEGTLGHRVYDPAADEAKNLSVEEQSSFRRWKSEDPARFRETVRKIIAWDLDRIERESGYLIAVWDRQSARGGGTAAEITLAHRLGKPVYLVLGMPVEEASGWVLAAADEVFPSFEELQAALLSRFGGERS
ncbi:MAG: nucleoside 2-deoxyribosyltransferase [Acidobacteria bacterium]|nr:nucleoside 2-deoxyribosyltransferase [Acidobacteriota bacterium]MCA1611961.1 nucleoside 2-deoxyribosyltransferase [Acidobacteriota bacterium]MCA1617297.1 nucleoside 2-deoxyribosyltransferase [Acidobacteriota bacterium]